MSLDVTALELAERAAAHDGMSTTASLSRAARREAVRTGVGPAVDVLAELDSPTFERLAGALRAALDL